MDGNLRNRVETTEFITEEDLKKTQTEQTEIEKSSTTATIESSKDFETRIPKKSRRFIGISFSILTAIIGPLSDVAVKALVDYNPITIASWRFIGLLVATVPLFVWHFKDVIKGRGGIKSWRTGMFLLLRCITSTSSLLCHYFALKYITVGGFKAIGSSKTLFVTVLAHMLLKERCGWLQPIACLFVLIGLTIVAKPPFLLGDTDVDTDRIFGTLLALGVLIFSTASDVLLRRLRTVHYTLLSLTYGMFGLFVTFTLELSLFQEIVLPRNGNDFGLAVALSAVVVITQNLVNFAFKFEHASINALVRSSTLIFGYIWGYIIFGKVPDKYSLDMLLINYLDLE